MNYNNMRVLITSSFNRGVFPKLIGPVSNYTTFQEMVYHYLCRKEYWKQSVQKLTSGIHNDNLKIVEDYLLNPRLHDIPNQSKVTLLSSLSYYIATINQRQLPKEMANNCDDLCLQLIDPSPL